MIMGTIVSFAYIGIIMLVATFIQKSNIYEKEFSRKFIHIMVGNWVFVAFYYFDNFIDISIVPLIFIVLNYLSKKYKIVLAMERDDDSWGTVWYAVSLLFLCSLSKLIDFPALAYSGILSMAYGDGLAAIIGQKHSVEKKFIYGKKTLQGSLTVFVVIAVVVSVVDVHFFDSISYTRIFSIAIVGTLLELFSERGFDNLILPIGVGIYYTFSHIKSPLELFILSISIIVILIIAYFKKSLTIDGVVAAFLVGITFYSLGNFWAYSSLILFFIVGSISSKITNNLKERAIKLHERDGHRNWIQVLSNSAPALFFLWMGLVQGQSDVFILVAITNFAVSTSDTLSSEIGMLAKGKTYSILSFKEVERGISGGVSIQGLLGGILGSMIISLMATSYGIKSVLIIFVLGFLGTIIDSLFGVVLQRKYFDKSGNITERKYLNGEELLLASGFSIINNDFINLLSISFITLLSYYIFNNLI